MNRRTHSSWTTRTWAGHHLLTRMVTCVDVKQQNRQIVAIGETTQTNRPVSSIDVRIYNTSWTTDTDFCCLKKKQTFRLKYVFRKRKFSKSTQREQQLFTVPPN